MASANDWLTRKEAVIYLGTIGCPLSPRALELMARHDNAGRGPPFIRIRATVRYRRAELDRWAEREVVRVG